MCTRDVGICHQASDLYLLEIALRLFMAIIATHILAGEVDTTLSQGNFLRKVSWLLRYFNPVNLCWRYYSILAYRFLADSWGEKQLAVINFEGYPYRSPIPYFVAEKIEGYRVGRLEMPGLLGSQGLLSMITAYDVMLSTQYVLSTKPSCFLPTITKPLGLFGFLRVLVSKWLTNKLYIQPYPYPPPSDQCIRIDCKFSMLPTYAWLAVVTSFLTLCNWPFLSYSDIHVRYNYVELSMNLLYAYTAISIFFFHVILLLEGPGRLANRIAYFDHWIYKLQTSGFLLALLVALVTGIVDFISQDYYKLCEY
eukprot:c24170_g1_i1 orf=266-1192(-)